MIPQGGPEARALMKTSSWPEKWRDGRAPLQIRIIKFNYDFSRVGSKEAAKGQWWTRKKVVGEYLPPLSLDNPSLQQFMRDHQINPVELDRAASKRPGLDAQSWSARAGDAAIWLREHASRVVQGAFMLTATVLMTGLFHKWLRGRPRPAPSPSKANKGKTD